MARFRCKSRSPEAVNGFIIAPLGLVVLGVEDAEAEAEADAEAEDTAVEVLFN